MKEQGRAKPKRWSGWVMLSITLSLYLLSAYYDLAKAIEALTKSFEVLKSIAPVLLVVLFLMALLATFIRPKHIARQLGEESGLRGWSIALSGGVLSHGSTYVWYPMLSELRAHGARDGLIVAFLYARAIKLPWLPVMISYFGLTFTMFLSLYIVIAAWMQGQIAERWLQRQGG